VNECSCLQVVVDFINRRYGNFNEYCIFQLEPWNFKGDLNIWKYDWEKLLTVLLEESELAVCSNFYNLYLRPKIFIIIIYYRLKTDENIPINMDFKAKNGGMYLIISDKIIIFFIT
jgi:hypothetical protein